MGGQESLVTTLETLVIQLVQLKYRNVFDSSKPPALSPFPRHAWTSLVSFTPPSPKDRASSEHTCVLVFVET
jgi:hypothetical protein